MFSQGRMVEASEVSYGCQKSGDFTSKWIG